MFKIDFKNKRVDFFRLATFAKKNNLNHKECLMQAFNQNVLIEENVVLLKNFINSFENIEQINSQLYQDVFASFIIGEKFEKTYLEFGATDGLNLSNSYLLEYSFNWKGVLSEPSPQWHEALIKNRKKSNIITKCIWKESGKKLDFFMSDAGELSTLKDFLESDVSSRLHPNLKKKKPKFSSVEKAKKPRLSYFIASSMGFIAVVFYSLLPKTEDSFASFASNEIMQAIESPSALDVLNGSVQGLDVILQDYKSSQNGTLANYRFPSSGKTFKVSLYPMQEINKINLSEAAKISYIKSDKGVYVVSVTGDISTDKKNQILQKANIFADRLN